METADQGGKGYEIVEPARQGQQYIQGNLGEGIGLGYILSLINEGGNGVQADDNH
jgi:hypothetical protein